MVRQSQITAQLDAPLPDEWTASSQREDAAVRLERLTGLQLDWPRTHEWVGTVREDVLVTAESLLGTRNVLWDEPVRLEWGAGSRRDYAMPAEASGVTRGDAAVASEITGNVRLDASVPLEWAASWRADYATPAEWLGSPRLDWTRPTERASRWPVLLESTIVPPQHELG